MMTFLLTMMPEDFWIVFLGFASLAFVLGVIGGRTAMNQKVYQKNPGIIKPEKVIRIDK